MKISECKIITINKYNDILPAYEIKCPCCKNTIIIETEIADNVNTIFCYYCKAQVEAKT